MQYELHNMQSFLYIIRTIDARKVILFGVYLAWKRRNMRAVVVGKSEGKKRL